MEIKTVEDARKMSQKTGIEIGEILKTFNISIFHLQDSASTLEEAQKSWGNAPNGSQEKDDIIKKIALFI